MTRAMLVAALGLLCSLPACSSSSSKTPAGKGKAKSAVPGVRGRTIKLPPMRKGQTIPLAMGKRPRIKRIENLGLRALPDGELREWAEFSGWLTAPVVVKGATRAGKQDLDARLGLASYPGGLSLAIKVTDDVPRHAKFASALNHSDHIVVELWPLGDRKPGPLARALLGVKLRFGTRRQLVEMVKGDKKRLKLIAATGVAESAGYRLETKVPLASLTPLPAPRIHRLRYRVTVYDTDADRTPARATLRFEGEKKLDPPMQVPEAVQKRASVRICQAVMDDALWGYWYGWRCAVPYRRSLRMDRKGDGEVVLAYARVADPPKAIWIHERMMFVNIPGRNVGLAALLDRRDTITSVMKMGVIGAVDPGNPLNRESGAEVLKLPDGSWAMAVVNAHQAMAGLGGECANGHKVYLSVLALRGAYTSTPHKPAPEPTFAPYLEEILKVQLEDCEGRVANDWKVSKDRSMIRVHSSLFPTRPPTAYVFQKGRYVPKPTDS